MTFSTPMVTTTEKVTRIMVNSRYWLERSKLLNRLMIVNLMVMVMVTVMG